MYGLMEAVNEVVGKNAEKLSEMIGNLSGF